MTRWLQTEDWKVFDRYSPRIYKISRLFTSSVHSTSYDIDFSIYQNLHRFRPGNLLFPSLQTLVMLKNLPDVVGYNLALLPLISPSLRTLELLTPHPPSSQYLARFLNLSHSSQTQLRHVQIYGRSAFESSRAVAHLNRLEYLDINFHNTEDQLYVQPGYTHLLNDLSKLASLSSLLISPPMSLSSAALSKTGFQQLKHLAMTGGTTTFNDICRMTTQIEYLVLEACHPEKLVAWRAFFNTLKTYCPLLKDIVIYGNFSINDMPISVVWLLEPLFDLSLKVVCMRSELPIRVQLSDADVSTITGIWPDLVALEIFPRGQYTFPNVPTLKGVKAALTKCDGLRHLVMSCWNEVVDLSVNSHQVSENTLDNTYPPFVTFG